MVNPLFSKFGIEYIGKEKRFHENIFFQISKANETLR